MQWGAHSKSNFVSDLATVECLLFSGKEQGLREGILDVYCRYKDSLTGSDVEFQYVGHVNFPKSVWGSWNNHAVSLWLRSMCGKLQLLRLQKLKLLHLVTTSAWARIVWYHRIPNKYQKFICGRIHKRTTMALPLYVCDIAWTSWVYGTQRGWTIKTIKISIAERAQGSSVLCKLWDAVQHEEKSDSSTGKLKLPSPAKQCLNTRRTLWDSQPTHYIKKRPDDRFLSPERLFSVRREWMLHTAGELAERWKQRWPILRTLHEDTGFFTDWAWKPNNSSKTWEMRLCSWSIMEEK